MKRVSLFLLAFGLIVFAASSAMAGVVVKNLEDYWANQRAYHQNKIEPLPEIWMQPTRPSADDAWTPPKEGRPTGMGVAVTDPVAPQAGFDDALYDMGGKSKSDSASGQSEQSAGSSDDGTFNPFGD